MLNHRHHVWKAVRSAVLFSALLMLGLGIIGVMDLTRHGVLAVVWSSTAALWFLWETAVEPVVDRKLRRLLGSRLRSDS